MDSASDSLLSSDSRKASLPRFLHTISSTSGGEQKLNQFTVIVCRSKEELAARVATVVAARSLEFVGDTYNIGLTVGATPSDSYDQLCQLYKRGIADLSRCHFWLLDEFFNQSVDPLTASGDRSSLPHRAELTSSLLHSIPSEAIHGPELSPSGDLNAAVTTYKEKISFSPLDLVILSISPEGHVGWLNDSTNIDEDVHHVKIADVAETFSKGYTHCITLGLRHIMTAREVIILSIGRNKAEIVSALFSGKKQSVVATILQNHPNVTCFLDPLAAYKLSDVLNSSHQASLMINDIAIWKATNIPFVGRNIICISPHPDDSCISAGATLNFLSQENTVSICIATAGHRAYIENTTKEDRIKIRENEVKREASALSVRADFLRLPLYDRGSRMSEEDVEIVEKHIRASGAGILFTPHLADTHPTHRAVLATTLHALHRIFLLKSQAAGNVPEENTSEETPQVFDVYMYEGPWALFNPLAYDTICSPPPRCFDAKMKAVKEHVSQTGRTPYDKATESLAILRAALVPEQDLTGYGGQPPKLEEKVELFRHMQVKCASDVQALLHLFDQKIVPPRK